MRKFNQLFKNKHLNNMTESKINWKKYLYEFLTIFIGVTLAFALTKWNDNNNRFESSEKTLLEIKNGLSLDLYDLSLNRKGHGMGIYACEYFRDYLSNEPINKDSIGIYYRALLRDYLSIQNRSGYESLKSKGLELIKDDSLRLEIISLYDFHFEIIEKLEETYSENQFHRTYFSSVNNMLAEYMVFDKNGKLIDITPPNGLSKKEKKLLLSYFWKIESNRKFTYDYYGAVEEKVRKLISLIEKHVKDPD